MKAHIEIGCDKSSPKEEVEEVKKTHDPIDHIKDILIQKFKVKEETLKQIDKEIREIIKEAVDYALKSPEPDPSELYTDILIGEQPGEKKASPPSSQSSNDVNW